ncbi:exodeoxyribonuclease VII large subunit [Streptococcus sp. DD13]|uniref:exodeoxyribonuclease VII large subunit n=1 Tax=Streptococcus sp. DD13 TaxID=1777881 RepID=UPI0007955E3B|nr:exodeoxyribonuclease VII large subunit [Streptococcus sp. DD13]KXT79246.1 Exodeoxyribonuclease VII large subunit [Streptococcus sp. DD13]
MVEYLSVSQLTKYLKLKFDRDPYLERVYLTGQVSNFRRRPTHQYFSLKDEQSVIQATVWSGVYQKLGFDLEEGMKVNVVGRVQLYEPNGSYSIIIEKIEPDGLGALALKFEQLRQALTKEGLFRADLKQTLPRFSKRIGVVTSPSGAVIQDIITTVNRRYPNAEILLYPTKVQGDGAAEAIASNIQKANQRGEIDVLIVGRGGGSIEDLWAFNEEIVVRAIFESRIPVISSVGHETDTTLSDYVADYRAATPTAAAELATPVTKLDLLTYLQQSDNRMSQALAAYIQKQRKRIDVVQQSVVFRQPERLYDSYLLKLDRLSNDLQVQMTRLYDEQRQQFRWILERLKNQSPKARIEGLRERLVREKRMIQSSMTQILDRKTARFEQISQSLELLDTKKILARGFAIVSKNNVLLRSVDQVKEGEEWSIQLQDGQVEVEVKHARKEKNI